MGAMTAEKTNELWANVIAQEKMPTLLKLGFVPENIWNGKIRNIVVEMHHSTRSSENVTISTKFEWEVDQVSYEIKMALPHYKVSKGTTKKELLYAIHDKGYIIFYEKRIINELEFITRFDCGNNTNSKDLIEIIDILICRVFAEVFDSFR